MWVLLKYRIEFSEYPADIGNLTLRTEPRGYNKLFAFRNFELLDNGRILAKASSTWSLVDFVNKSLVNVETVVNGNPYMTKMVPNETDLKYQKIPIEAATMTIIIINIIKTVDVLEEDDFE
jgi:hypothetical protein